MRMFGLASLLPPTTHRPIGLLSKQTDIAESDQSCGNCLETEVIAIESQIPVELATRIRREGCNA